MTVLTEFTRKEASHRVNALVEELGMTKNMVHRALTTLVEEGLIVRDANNQKYELGFGVLDLFTAGYEEPDINEICRPYMQMMHDLTGLTVALHIPVGHNHVTIDGIEGRGNVLARVDRGIPVPLNVSPGSRAILAALSDSEIEAYIRKNSPLPKMTENTLTEPDQLWKDVQQTRSQGYARGLKDHFLDAIGISFPVLDIEGRPHGSITVVGPDRGTTAETIDKCLDRLVAMAKDLNGITRLYQASPIVLVTT